MSKPELYKVLHIFSSYGGGISSLVLSLIENKSESFKFDIMAFSYKNGDVYLEHIRKAGGEVYQMPRPRIEGYLKFKKFIDDVLTINHYDAIHCHITGWHAKPFIDAAKRHKIKNFILHAHTTKYDSRIDRFLPVQIYDKYLNYKYSVAYMTCSDMAANYIFGEKYLKKRTAYLIPNGINKELFLNKLNDERAIAYSQEFSVSKDTFVIGHVGRFSYPKNHFFILDIVRALREKGVNFAVILVGSGELFEVVKEKAMNDGLIGNIRFIGRRTDIATLMQYFDCMILPSFYEGLPTVAIECQAAGTRMILSDTITNQCDMKLGLIEFCPIDNAVNWANILMKNLTKKHSDTYECLATIERQGFTAKEAGKKYCSILKDIINQNG